MSDGYKATRFEWVTILEMDDSKENGKDKTDAFAAETCPKCGWVDGDRVMETLSGKQGMRECFRCGEQWVSARNMEIECYAYCEICKKEVYEKGQDKKYSCKTCGRIICKEHSFYCSVCKEIICKEHLIKCEMGCSICSNCAGCCSSCGENIFYCKNHLIIDSNGDSTCFVHKCQCTTCQKLFSTQKISTCSICGQTLCVGCLEYCYSCDEIFCSGHIFEGRCSNCQPEK